MPFKPRGGPGQLGRLAQLAAWLDGLPDDPGELQKNRADGFDYMQHAGGARAYGSGCQLGAKVEKANDPLGPMRSSAIWRALVPSARATQMPPHHQAKRWPSGDQAGSGAGDVAAASRRVPRPFVPTTVSRFRAVE